MASSNQATAQGAQGLSRTLWRPPPAPRWEVPGRAALTERLPRLRTVGESLSRGAWTPGGRSAQASPTRRRPRPSVTASPRIRTVKRSGAGLGRRSVGARVVRGSSQRF